MKPTVLGILLVLVLIVAGSYFLALKDTGPSEAPEVRNSYENQRFAFSFEYPLGYVSQSQEEGRTVILVQEADAQPVEGGEGPTAITVTAYPLEEGGTLEEWLSTNESNHMLGDGTTLETSVAGAPAVRYSWSGLYEGETTAFVHANAVIAVSVTYLTPEDKIRADYESVLASFALR